MKFYATLASLIVVAGILIIGCSKSNPAGYVDGYTVKLTDDAGTTYAGDFFPLRAGHACSFSGEENITYTATMTGQPSENDTIVGPTVGMLSILPEQNVILQSGTYSLFPVVEYSGDGVYDTSRYYMKDTQCVYVKALKLSDGSFTEINNSIFLKSSLVAGDSWESTPQMNITQIVQAQSGLGDPGSNLQSTANAKSFVVGHEVIDLPIGVRNTVRLEQANDISVTGSVISEGVSVNMKMSAKVATIYNLIADTGVVHQSASGTINITASAQGETVTINMKINEYTLGLTNVYDGPVFAKVGRVPANSREIARNETSSSNHRVALKTPAQVKLLNISQRLVKSYLNQLGLEVQR
jgi:hypothetical protein